MKDLVYNRKMDPNNLTKGSDCEEGCDRDDPFLSSPLGPLLTVSPSPPLPSLYDLPSSAAFEPYRMLKCTFRENTNNECLVRKRKTLHRRC